MSAKTGYIGIKILNGGYVVSTSDESYEEGVQIVLTSKAKVIKLVRETLEALEGAPEADTE